MAPPLMFTISGFRLSSRITANPCEAKASFNSTKSISFKLIPDCFNTLGTASTGPIPMMRGFTPATAQFTKRAMGFRFNSFTMRSLITITKAAPSLVCDELPAVTVPFTANAGLSFAKASTFVSARTPSSVSTTKLRFAFLPLASKYTSSTVMGRIPLLKCPFSMAVFAFICELYANASWSSRLTLKSFATASAVKPMLK